MLLTERCKSRISVGSALPGSKILKLCSVMLVLMVYGQDFMLHVKYAAHFRCSTMSIHLWGFLVRFLDN